MKRCFLFSICVICAFATSVQAQKGLYGLTSSGGKFGVGTILSTDTNGSFQTKHDLFRFDGSNPQCELVEASNGLFYGGTPGGGSNSKGLIFSYNASTGVYKKIFDMTNSTGSTPYGTLIEGAAGTLYGTASNGGSNGDGVIFSYDINTNIYTVLHDMDGTTGEEPWGELTLNGGFLYGLSRFGGGNNRGTIFQLEIATNNYSKLYDFSDPKGRYPLGGVEVINDKLIGVTSAGGDYNGGVLFSYDLNSSTYTRLHDFDATSGMIPFRGIIEASDGWLYGMTSSGGSSSTGTIYKYDIDTDTLIVLKNLNVLDGRNPLGKLTQASNGLIYGMMQFGGAFSRGTIFSLNISTSTYTVLVNMAQSDGTFARAGVVQGSNGNLYGLAYQGGENNSGTLGEYDISGGTWTVKVNLNTSDGAIPQGEMVVASNGKMYGLTPIGGTAGNLGVIFEYDPILNIYTPVHSFDQVEGSFPYGSLIEGNDGKLYGMTSDGGASAHGIIFSYDPATNNFTKKIDLTLTNGSKPLGSLVLANNGLMYGMTSKGGSGKGVIFSYDPNTNNYTKIISLNNSSGKNPEGSLIQAADGKLYGTTRNGGADSLGTLISLDPAGNVFSKLFDFSLPTGSEPTGNLIEAQNGLLYGMCSDGGASIFGTIFTWDINTNTHNVVHDFDQTNGEAPNGSLVELPNGTMFGMTLLGGNSFSGTVFRFRPGTTQFTKLRDLSELDGIFPFGNLVYFEPPGLKLNIRAFLEGPYNSISGLMDDDLRSAGYIPTSEPFTGLGFSHFGDGGGETIDPAILNVTGNNAIVDWIFIELRDKNNSATVVSTRSALVQRDGDIVDTDGVSELVFEDDADDYFVAVRHRNHLGVMTLNSLSLSSSIESIDFTLIPTPTYGSNAQTTIGGTNALWMGNSIFDDELKYTGLNNDRDPILVAIGGTVPTSTITGYHSEDCSMDGVVKYTGLNNDRDPILVNIGGTVPTNTRQEQLP